MFEVRKLEFSIDLLLEEFIVIIGYAKHVLGLAVSYVNASYGKLFVDTRQNHMYRSVKGGFERLAHIGENDQKPTVPARGGPPVPTTVPGVVVYPPSPPFWVHSMGFEAW